MNRNSKNVVRLTESKLRDMIKESVTQVLSEDFNDTLNNLKASYKSGKEAFKSSQAWNKERDNAKKSLYRGPIYRNRQRDQRDAEKGVDMVLNYISNAKIPVSDEFVKLLTSKIEELSNKYFDAHTKYDEPTNHLKWW